MTQVENGVESEEVEVEKWINVTSRKDKKTYL